MTYLIQPLKQFTDQIRGRNVFVEGFIYRRQLDVDTDERAQLACRYEKSPEEFQRAEFESSVVLTTSSSADGIIRATKIRVEFRRILGEIAGIENEYHSVKRNVRAAVDICFEKIIEAGAAQVEAGVLQTPGLSEELKNEGLGSRVSGDWWMIEKGDGRLLPKVFGENEKCRNLLMEILSQSGAATA